MMGFNFGVSSLWMTVLMTLFWVLVIAAVVWLLSAVLPRTNRDSGQSLPPAQNSALDIVKQRYARGEINKEQFEEMRRSLEA